MEFNEDLPDLVRNIGINGAEIDEGCGGDQLRTSAAATTEQKPITYTCQVEGCEVTLSKPYDKKAKTCSIHRRSLQVDILGFPCRFCQKCSRFHSLDAFDGEKHNCRTQLLKHNFRQRRLRTLRKMHKGQESPEQADLPQASNSTAADLTIGPFQRPALPNLAPPPQAVPANMYGQSMLGQLPIAEFLENRISQIVGSFLSNNLSVAVANVLNAFGAGNAFNASHLPPLQGGSFGGPPPLPPPPPPSFPSAAINSLHWNELEEAVQHIENLTALPELEARQLGHHPPPAPLPDPNDVRDIAEHREPPSLQLNTTYDTIFGDIFPPFD